MTNRIAARLVSSHRGGDEHGMTTAEYAVGTVSACSFAAVLYKLLTSGFGEQLLQSLLDKVLQILPM